MKRPETAAYHAAQTLVFDATGKAAKTHNGVRSEFARLAQRGGRAPRVTRDAASHAADVSRSSRSGRRLPSPTIFSRGISMSISSVETARS